MKFTYYYCLVLLFICLVRLGKFAQASSEVEVSPRANSGSSPKSSVLYHETNPDSGKGTNQESRLQTQESRPRGRRQSYSYGATQRPVSYHESYNSPPYYYESNNPPQSYHHEYHSPPSSYNVDYNERPRNHHHSYQSPRNQHRSSYNNQDSNEYHDGDERSYGSDNNSDDHHGGGGYGGDNDSEYRGDDDYGHSPSNNHNSYAGEGSDDYGRVNLEY